MQCEMCNEQEATVHLTQVVEGSIKKLHLCESCAQQNGFDVQGPISITDILLGMGVKKDVAVESGSSAETSCPRCHMRRTDFKKTGRFGCAVCYETFADDLPPLLKAMHRNDHHVGKFPEAERNRYRYSVELERLEEKLRQAIDAEHYEKAASIRDEIRSIREASAAETENES